jgi:hypothetical protein
VLSNNELTKIELTAADSIRTTNFCSNNNNSNSKNNNNNNSSSSSLISGHEKLSYLFSVWRMEGEWNSKVQ